MKKLVVAGLAACLTVFLASGSPTWANSLEIEMDEQAPSPIIVDREALERVWTYIKKEAGAPDDLSMPPFVASWKIFGLAIAAFSAPTEEAHTMRPHILLVPNVGNEESNMVLWYIAHELTHYAFLMRHNDWDVNRKTFDVGKPHHCDPEFKRVTHGAADAIWDIYHGDTALHRSYGEVERSCRVTPLI